MTVLGTTLPLATMPKETLVSILERCVADETVKNRAFSVWESQKKLLDDTLSGSFVHECIPVADEESLFSKMKATLFIAIALVILTLVLLMVFSPLAIPFGIVRIFLLVRRSKAKKAFKTLTIGGTVIHPIFEDGN